MQECLTEKYRHSPRSPTHLTIDYPVLIFGKLTFLELLATVGTFMGVVISSSGFGLLYAPFLAGVVLGILLFYRKKLIPGAFMHWAWMQRLLSGDRVPRLFNTRYLGRFG